MSDSGRLPISNIETPMQLSEGTASWTWQQAALYGLGIGCQPDGPELQYICEGLPEEFRAMDPDNANWQLKPFPTYPVVLGVGGNALRDLTSRFEFDLPDILHGGQRLTLYRPLGSSGEINMTGALTAVRDKGKFGQVCMTNIGRDASGLLFETTAEIMLRGRGGWGGDKGPDDKVAIPDRDPDFSVTYQTLPMQAAVYRLSGDLNPLHIWPAFAAFAGQPKPILHGLCTFGHAGRALVSTLCGNDPHRFKSIYVQFRGVVLPGDSLTTKIWKTGDGQATFVTEQTDGKAVLANCTFEYAEAA